MTPDNPDAALIKAAAKAFAAEYWHPDAWDSFADDMQQEIMRCQDAAIAAARPFIEAQERAKRNDHELASIIIQAVAELPDEPALTIGLRPCS